MCIEDIRLGRKTSFRYRYIGVGGTPVRVVDANARRTHLIFSGGVVAGIRLWFDAGLDSATGFRVHQSLPPLEFDIQEHGLLVTGDFYAVAELGSEILVVAESILQET